MHVKVYSFYSSASNLTPDDGGDATVAPPLQGCESGNVTLAEVSDGASDDRPGPSASSPAINATPEGSPFAKIRPNSRKRALDMQSDIRDVLVKLAKKDERGNQLIGYILVGPSR